MTADELRKLAEIAGLKLSSVGELLQSGSRYYHGNIKNRQIIPTYEWQPHLRIEQAMMVAEAFDYYELGKDMSSAAPYYCQIFTGIGGRLIGQAISMNLPTAICVSALAAAKEV